MKMEVIEKDKRQRLSKLFQDYKWNYLPDAILDGCMGRALADDQDQPRIALLEAQKIKLGIVGGDSEHPSAREYIEQLPIPKALIFASEDWEKLMQEIHASRLVRLPRYAFTSERLDIQHLRELAARSPDGYQLEQMDLDLARRLAAEKSEFAEDHMVNFDSPEDFVDRGFGFCLLDGDQIVSVATTFAICHRGVEIQINTREEHQGRGLATVVAANLMVHSLQNGLDPNWDAANEPSVGLARKLGYTPQGTYAIYVVVRSRLVAIIGRFGLRVKAFLKK
jgi:RimJ/RimL family protein N-acetyltransferase